MARKISRKSRKGNLGAKLDSIVQLLEDIFILQASGSQLPTGTIQKIMGIRKARISRIAKGMKKARKHGQKKA
jgi:hypothetical protein